MVASFLRSLDHAFLPLAAEQQVAGLSQVSAEIAQQAGEACQPQFHQEQPAAARPLLQKGTERGRHRQVPHLPGAFRRFEGGVAAAVKEPRFAVIIVEGRGKEGPERLAPTPEPFAQEGFLLLGKFDDLQVHFFHKKY